MNSRLKVVHGQILSTQNVTSEVIGTRFGLSAYEMNALKGRLGDIQRELELKFKNDAELRVDQMAWMKLGFQDEAHLALIEQYAQDIRQNFEDFLVVGIGGSSLGAKALLHALNYRGAKNQTPNIVFLENADPETLARFENNLIERRGKLDFSKVLVNVISKSGTTAETAANFELLIEHMKKSNLSDADIAKRVIATTDAEKGTLRKTALDKGYRTLVVPDGVGGRFSVFSDVGLLPLAVGGVDIRRLLGGVKKGFDRVFLEFQDPLNHAFQIASLLYLLDQKKGAHLHCLFVFGEAFEEIAAWFEQLWAESLGKNGGGPRPLGMIGARALHSIHQDNVGGKRDKAIFLVGVQNPRVEGEASRILSLMLECAIRDLTDCGRPNMTLILPRIDEENLGELLFTLEMATHVVGRLYQVNPYDQPAVEEAKVGARQALLALQKVSSENRVLGPLQKPAIAFENIKAENIGVEHGLASNEIQSLTARLKKIHQELKDAEKNSISTPEMAWLKFSTKAEIDEIKKIGDEVAIETDLLILIGMGGAVSGAKALLNALGYVGRKKGRPDIFIIENIDSESFVRLESRMKSMYQGRIDYSRTSVCAISQSGDTVETLTNLKTVWEMMSKDDSSENDLGKKTVIITNLKNGALLKVAKEKGCKTLRASDALMGLLGVFGNNGLFPLAVTGWNLERFIIGTKRGFQRSLTASLNEENYAFRLAESFYLLDTLKKKDLHGFFLYSDALKGVAEWLEQLWVEALAKSEIEGPRPLVMIGSTAQHSVNQDNIAGRNDKAILFVGVQSPRADYVMSGQSVDYLRGNRMSELLEACREGTSNALTLRQRPNMTLVIPKIDEENLGEFFFTMAMTAHVLARLYGVDPYRQPAVENFKVKLRSRLQGEAY